MPYNNDAELPDSVKDNLPNHAQDIYREAFNSAWEEYKDASKPRERIAGRGRP
jgi:cation transport regulator